ncbi:hypothetical protein ACEV9E_10650 [Vibrio parahaemolyticus]|uniref:Tetratricopeptide repeat protein n=12 Tax=Vibrio parahaemolyticus TaxID=670 RepID=A0A7M1WL09_VIBPH|nr:hypothetical protein [Vibrio parahaemolyticus]AHI98204.1 hypothetical protein VPUCM_0246 [Vibrio parahaemolyticus UCM-V493]EHR7858676.1 hypothetical protein [Vibrio parahaemolyticus]EIA0832301.1 hypothetical protein [Vibrio parahaemolyticus]EJC6930496.1 hypothetical protein [Vibrio parahaemolyticus]EJE8522920.1 hypothetical protein [Vibrio parahaemolyticus]
MKDRTLIIDCNSVYLDNDEKCPLDKKIYRGADFLKADITSEDLTSLLSFYRSYETCILLPPTLLNFNNNIAKFREFMDRCTKPTMIKINSFEGKYSELNEYFIFLDFLSINLGRSVDIVLDACSLGLEHNSDVSDVKNYLYSRNKTKLITNIEPADKNFLIIGGDTNHRTLGHFLEKANEAFHEKDYQTSAEMFRDVITICHDPDILDKFSLSCIYSRSYELLIDAYELLVNSCRFNFTFLSRVGFAYLKEGDLLLARQSLESSININSEQPVALFNLGKVYYSLGLLERSFECLNYSLILRNDVECRSLIDSLFTENQNLRMVPLKNSIVSPDVCLGRKGELFLQGGAHKIKDFSSGNKEAEISSINNFFENISNRKKICLENGTKYLHVVFPDNSSISRCSFPYVFNESQYENYVRRFPNFNTTDILYPLKPLSEISEKGGIENEVVLKGDSHLSDVGYRVILEALLTSLEGEASDSLTSQIFNDVNATYSQSSYVGDLGVKYKPHIKFERLTFCHVYDTTPLNNGILSNDGLVRIWENENSLIDKVVLVFSDSYFNFMSRYLSLVYKRVIFCRTRYFHKEVFDNINPDIVLTGNAERYLSHVNSDDRAALFNCYYEMKEINEDQYLGFYNKALELNYNTLLMPRG